MSDEFDDALDAEVLLSRQSSFATTRPRARYRTARLAVRLYARASTSQRGRMLACMLRPLSPLGVVAVASGAFASCLSYGGDGRLALILDDVGRYTNDQIFELARFVEQVSPDALQELARLVAGSSAGIAAFSAAAALLLLRQLRGTALLGQAVGHRPDAVRIGHRKARIDVRRGTMS